jgi:hypothetical protein
METKMSGINNWPNQGTKAKIRPECITVVFLHSYNVLEFAHSVHDIKMN